MFLPSLGGWVVFYFPSLVLKRREVRGEDLVVWLTMAPLSSAPLEVCAARPHPVDVSMTFNKLVALARLLPSTTLIPHLSSCHIPMGGDLGNEPACAQEGLGAGGPRSPAEGTALYITLGEHPTVTVFPG